MKLYFVRHGKTEWNLEGRFQGSSGDSPLLESSIPEVRLLGQSLSNITFDVIYSSDLKRALDTALIINQENQTPTDIYVTPQLREWQLGRLEGQKINLMSDIYPTQMEAFFHNLACFDASIFEAETVFETTHRIEHFIKSLADQHLEHVLIVGHGANLTASINHLLGYERGQLRHNGGLHNASLTILETHNFSDFDLLTWNDKSYLEEISITY